MHKRPPTKAATIRLSLSHWEKLRSLMQQSGRQFLENFIDREHKRREAKKEAK